MKLGLKFPERLAGPLYPVREALEDLIIGIERGWSQEHLGTGQHNAITAQSIGNPTLSETTPLAITSGVEYRQGPISLSQANIGNLPDPSVLTPPQITANTNDYSPYGLDQGLILRLNVDAARTITGLRRPQPTQARLYWVVNTTTSLITLSHESANSAASNRWYGPGAADYVLLGYGAVAIVYDPIQLRWRILDSRVALANPTASLGLAAVNGTAVTAMRSDGAPALDQSIAPTWTGAHIFKAAPTINMGNPTIKLLTSAASAHAWRWTSRDDLTDDLTLDDAVTIFWRINASGLLALGGGNPPVLVSGAQVSANAASPSIAWRSTSSGHIWRLTSRNDLSDALTVDDASNIYLRATTAGFFGLNASNPSIPLDVSDDNSTGGNGIIRATQSATVGGYAYVSNAKANAGTYYHVNFQDAGTQHGSITSNGTNVAYNTSSDERLKRDRGLASSLAVLIGTRIHEFEWIATGTTGRGIFAQEAFQIAPFAITRGDDAPGGEFRQPWSVDYAKYVPDLVVGWQNHEARLAALEAKGQAE